MQGAVGVLGQRAVWRVLCRDPAAFAASAAALVASCRQVTEEPALRTFQQKIPPSL